jgi:hypothetical protein
VRRDHLLGKLRREILFTLKPATSSAQTAISAVRRGRVVTMVGGYGMPYDNFPLGQIFDKGIALRFGQAPAQKYIDELLTWVEQRKIRLDDIITHRLPLDRHRTGMKASTRKTMTASRRYSSLDACRSTAETALTTGASNCIGLQLAHESAQNGTSACDHGTCEAELHALEFTTQRHYSR